MELKSRKSAVLLLEDGSIFKGTSLGKIGIATGEICFNTGMTGYQEIYTDPSYFGQIIINTSSHIGNYGAVDEEQESELPQINGVVINEYSYSYEKGNEKFSILRRLSSFNLKSGECFKLYDLKLGEKLIRDLEIGRIKFPFKV